MWRRPVPARTTTAPGAAASRPVTVVAFLVAISMPAAAGADSKPFYGKDDRVEIMEASEPLQRVARAVAAVFPSVALVPLDGEGWRLPAGPTGTERGWCPGERFAAQPATAACTGFLIAPDLLVTSAHCIRAEHDPMGDGLACDEARFVFDYRLDPDGTVETFVEAERVFGCLAVEGGEESPNGPDWRVVQLDGEPLDRVPPGVYVGEVLSPGTPLDIIGHPGGLPAKLARDGTVLPLQRAGFFAAELDAYLGSSGSPVLAQVDGENVVVGVLSRGESDFDEVTLPDGECRRSRDCTGGRCGGEHVTRADLFGLWASKTVP